LQVNERKTGETKGKYWKKLIFDEFICVLDSKYMNYLRRRQNKKEK